MENQTDLVLNEQAVEALKGSAKWSMFLAIMGFIGIGFMILAAIFMGSAMAMMPRTNSPFDGFKNFISLFYVILAALYFPPIFYMYKYASDLKNGLAARNSELVSNALVSLKSHHKYLGIGIIVFILLYIVGIIVFASMFAMSARG